MLGCSQNYSLETLFDVVNLPFTTSYGLVFTQCTWYIILKARNLYGSGFLSGGGGGIRTHGTLARTTVFKTAPINRSGTPPKDLIECKSILHKT